MTRITKPHGFVTRTIHWLAAGLLVFGYVKGLDDVSQLADQAVFQLEILFALGLGALFTIRLLWTKFFAGDTRLPDDAPRWERKASRIVHLGLYACVFGIVLSGLGIALAYSLPALSGLVMSGTIFLHEVFLNALPVLLFIHIVGALWHRLIRRDGVMESMLGRLSGC